MMNEKFAEEFATGKKPEPSSQQVKPAMSSPTDVEQAVSAAYQDHVACPSTWTLSPLQRTEVLPHLVNSQSKELNKKISTVKSLEKDIFEMKSMVKDALTQIHLQNKFVKKSVWENFTRAPDITAVCHNNSAENSSKKVITRAFRKKKSINLELDLNIDEKNKKTKIYKKTRQKHVPEFRTQGDLKLSLTWKKEL